MLNFLKNIINKKIQVLTSCFINLKSENFLLKLYEVIKTQFTYISFNVKIKFMQKKSNSEYISKSEVKEMIEDALRRHNRRSTIISSVLGWILIGGYSFGLFQAVQNV